MVYISIPCISHIRVAPYVTLGLPLLPPKILEPGLGFMATLKPKPENLNPKNLKPKPWDPKPLNPYHPQT